MGGKIEIVEIPKVENPSISARRANPKLHENNSSRKLHSNGREKAEPFSRNDSSYQTGTIKSKNNKIEVQEDDPQNDLIDKPIRTLNQVFHEIRQADESIMQAARYADSITKVLQLAFQILNLYFL